MVMINLTWAITVGTQKILTVKLIQLAANYRMLGGFTTCTAMFGSGAEIGMEITLVVA